jgi:hypothetical protein
MTVQATMSPLTSTLAGAIPARGIQLAQGEVQRINGSEFLPVAIVTYGFGGSDDSQWGMGGGGGGMVVPLGAYVTGDRGLRFRPNPVVILTVLIALVSVTGHALHKLTHQ